MRVRSALCFVVAALASVVLSSGCSSQGEGEFCDFANGNNDCQSNLVCVEQAPGLVGMTGITPSRCCPSDSTQATTSACMANVGGLDASNEVVDASAVDAPSETSASDAGGADATEASADAAHDALSPDAPLPDAPSSDGTTDHAAPPVADGAADAPVDAGDASDGAPD